MGAEQDPAEAAPAQLLEPPDAADHGLGRADQGRAHLHALAQGIVGPTRRAAERLLEVGDGLVPLGALHLAQGLLVLVRDVDVHHEAPVLPVHPLAVPGGGLLRDLPLIGQGLGPARQARAEREHAETVLARRRHAGGGDRARHGDREVRLGVRGQVETRLAQLEPVGLHRHRLRATKELHDGVERFLHAHPLGHGLDP